MIGMEINCRALIQDEEWLDAQAYVWSLGSFLSRSHGYKDPNKHLNY